jgi:DNA helicase II / ATP-dependent DNA helicase PcrA
MATVPVTLAQLRARLRSGQREIADWHGGPLAVAAVPGSGKSTGMAVAAAITIATHQLNVRRQLVVVTFTRSAAANIKGKIRGYLQELGLPMGGFVVYTLHGLAWAIARSAPELSGLNPDSILVTPTKSHRLIRTSIEQWIVTHPGPYQRLLEGWQFDGEETERLRRQSVLRTEILPDLANTIIREAKSSGLRPQDLLNQNSSMNPAGTGANAIADGVAGDYGVLAIAAGLYDSYQSQLTTRNLIDYDEMILAALRVLADPAVRQRWQTQVFAVFEDEAQDSSPLQTRLLEILARDPTDPQQQNLVRVGDPNQAINSTFTPADPIFFRTFCEQCAQQHRLATMQQAGRSNQRIIDAANFVLQWVNNSSVAGTETPFREQLIHPVPKNDPQAHANPPAEGGGLELHTPEDTYQTVQFIGQRAIALFQAHPDRSAAVLLRTNEQGRFVAKELRRQNLELPIYEVGQRDRQSQLPTELLTLLNFIDRPHSPDYLKAALTTLMDRRLIPTQDLNALTAFPEQFLYPGPLDPPPADPVLSARKFCRALVRSRLELPSYQLIPFVALSLYGDNQTELATADKLAERIAQQTFADNSLPAILSALNEIVSTEQFEPVDAENSEDRYMRPGQLTLITMHKAKGLDWDYVFIPFLHENMIPGSHWIPPQTKFLGDFTLAELARAQVRAMVHSQDLPADTALAWERAKNLKTAEEFRLLYVAMTRAKRLLWMSAATKAPFVWSKPDQVQPRSPSPVIPALRSRFPAAIVR